MANIGTLTAHIGIDNMGLNRGLTQAQGRFSQFSAGAMKNIVKIGGAFAALGAAVGALAIFKSITKTGIDFEQTMTTVAGVMRATADESKRLTAAARKMGETTEWSASEAGGALQFLGMAGFAANKAIAALPGTLDLATAGQIGLGRAADIATNALTAMGLEVNELERINDVFVGTITRSNTNMEMMAESFKYAAPVARAYGYTVEELSALIGMLGNAGIQGSMAGTQLAMAIQKTNIVAKKFGVPGGKFVDVLEHLREKGIAVADVMTAFGMRSGRAAGVLYEATDTVREFTETLGGVQGEAKRLADTMRSTVGASFKELKSVVESVALDVFEVYRDELKGFVVDTTTWIRENKDSIVGFVESVKTFLGGVMGVISSVATLLGSLGLGFIDFFETVESNAIDTANSIAESGERIRDALAPPGLTPWQEFWAFIKRAAIDVFDVLKFIVRGIGNLFAGLLKFIVADVIGNMILAFWDLSNVIVAALTLDLSGVQKWTKEYLGHMKAMWTGGEETGQAMIDAIGNAWSDMITDLKMPAWMDKIGAVWGEAGATGPQQWWENLPKGPGMETWGPQQFVGPMPAPPSPPTVGGGAMLTMPTMPTMPAPTWTDWLAGLQDMATKYKTIQENRLAWMYGREEVSAQEYMAFLERKLAGEEAYMSDWIGTQQQIAALKDTEAARDKARWAEQIAAQEEFLDLMFVGYDTFWQSILDLDMTGAERRKAIFESIYRAFVSFSAQALKQHIKDTLLQKTVTEGAERSKLAAVAAGTMGRIAFYIKEGAVAIASAAKSIYSAAAKIFEAHAWIPFVGVAIAAGFIGAMIATMSGLKKFHEGGLVGDEVLGIFKKKEYVVREPAVRSIGVPALEYMNRTGVIPGGGEGAIQLSIGDVTIGGTGTPKDFFLLDEFKDAVVDLIKEKLRNRELEM